MSVGSVGPVFRLGRTGGSNLPPLVQKNHVTDRGIQYPVSSIAIYIYKYQLVSLYNSSSCNGHFRLFYNSTHLV